MKKRMSSKQLYLPPTVESWQVPRAEGLLNTLSIKGIVEEWELEESAMDESNYI